ncbi:MAG: TIM barrel protein [Chloroflexi bacterium]|nr:TIM barrel protein [Chloroflexota bacterium]
MAVKLGTAPDSWGVWHPQDDLQTPWQRFLDEVVEAGYTRIELGPYGYLPTDPAVLRRELESRGLSLSGGTFGGPIHHADALPDLEEQVRRVGDLIGELGGAYLVLLPAAYRDETGPDREPRELDASGWQRLVEHSNRLGLLAQERSGGQQTVVFHPHADSHVETAAQVERYLDETDPSLVGLCLDTGHYAYRDGDSVDLMRRRPERIPYLHIKTVHGARLRDAHAQDLSFPQAVAASVFCEPADGVIDFPALQLLLTAQGFDGYAIVEHDLYPCAFDVPLPIARRTCAYLGGIGMG